jgi:hypothetical protein
VRAVPTESPTSDVPRPWLWIFPPIYFLHLLDERFFGIGTAAWATQHMGVYLTNDAWLIINVVWFILLTLTTWLVARGTLPKWVVVVLATHIAIHSLTRIWGSIVFAGWSPGVLTGVVVGMPWATTIFYRAIRVYSPRQVALGVIGGVLSLQPLWDFLMLPVLSPRPPAV